MSGLIEDLLTFCNGCKNDSKSPHLMIEGIETRLCRKLGLLMVKRGGRWLFETGWDLSSLAAAGKKEMLKQRGITKLSGDELFKKYGGFN